MQECGHKKRFSLSKKGEWGIALSTCHLPLSIMFRFPYILPRPHSSPQVTEPCAQPAFDAASFSWHLWTRILAGKRCNLGTAQFQVQPNSYYMASGPMIEVWGGREKDSAIYTDPYKAAPIISSSKFAFSLVSKALTVHCLGYLHLAFTLI